MFLPEEVAAHADDGVLGRVEADVALEGAVVVGPPAVALLGVVAAAAAAAGRRRRRRLGVAVQSHPTLGIKANRWKKNKTR